VCVCQSRVESRVKMADSASAPTSVNVRQASTAICASIRQVSAAAVRDALEPRACLTGGRLGVTVHHRRSACGFCVWWGRKGQGGELPLSPCKLRWRVRDRK